MSTYRIGFAGASGTGKSTLATWASKEYGLPLNPVGSRSVSAGMGFASPYDVDAAGRRAEFQRLCFAAKREWEEANRDGFVTDRTYLDNLAYSAMHCAEDVTPGEVDRIHAAMSLYTHVFVCPVGDFCNVDGDPMRKASMGYHRLYDSVLAGLFLHCAGVGSNLFVLHGSVVMRQAQVYNAVTGSRHGGRSKGW